MTGGRVGYQLTRHPNQEEPVMNDIYYAIVGTTTDTNMGLARFMGLILAFIVVVGTLFWAIG